MAGLFIFRKFFLKVYVRNSSVNAAPLDNETVLMSTEGNRYFSLNSLGSDIWELLEHPRSIPDLVSAIQADYDVEEDQARQDVIEFLEVLQARKLVSTQ
jgi:hypothetical protein